MADENNININIGSDPSGVESGSRRAKAAVGSVGTEAERLQSTFRKLKSSIDPLFAAQEKYNKSFAELRQLYAAGLIDGREFSQMQSQLRSQLAATTQEIEKNSAAGRAAAAEAKRLRQEALQAAKEAAAAEAQAQREASAASRLASREQTAAKKLAIAQEKAAIREAALAAKQAAVEKANAEKLAAREASAAERQARAEATAAVRAAAQAAKAEARAKATEEKAQSKAAADAERQAKRDAQQAAREAAATAKAEAKSKAQAERQASQEAAQAEREAKAQARQAARDAAQAAASAAKQKKQSEREAAAAARDAAEASRRQAIAERQAAQAAQDLRASIDPAYAAQMRYNQTMQTATQLLMQNKLQTGEWAAMQKQARATMDVQTRTLGRQNTAYVQMGYQMQDVIASWKSGINPLVILAQQGGQTAAAMSTMGGTVGRVAAFMAGPWGAAILGVTVLLGSLWQSEKEGKKATVDLMDAESRRKATLGELTDALKEFNKSQREANTLEAESLRLKGLAVQGTLDETQKKLADAQKRVTDLQSQINALQSTPSEGSEGALAVLYWQLSRAEDSVTTLKKQIGTLRQDSQGELAITGAMRDAEAQTDANTAAQQRYEAEVSAAQNVYRGARATALRLTDANAQAAALERARVTLTQQITAAINKRKAAEEAAAKATRDSAAAAREANNAEMTTFQRPVEGGTVTGGFGESRGSRRHLGTDIAVPVGTPIYAPAAGTVKRADGRDVNGYGNAITINFGGGTEGRFGHLSRFNVKPGDTVNAGDIIGYSGGAKGAPGSGDSSGPHLHYEIRRNGKPVDAMGGRFPTDPSTAASTEGYRLQEEARKKALEAQLEDYDYQKQLAEEDYNLQVEIQNKKIAALKSYYGENSREVLRAQRELTQMEQRHDREMLKLKQEQIRAQEELDLMKLNNEKEKAQGGLEDKQADIGFRQDIGQINPRQALEARRAILAEQYAMELDFENRMFNLKMQALKDQLALLPPLSTERQALNNQIEQLELQHQITMGNIQRGQIKESADINRQIATETVNKYRQITDTVGQGLSSMFQGMWTHSQTFTQGLINIADQIVYKFADMGIKMLTDWAARQLGMTAIHTAQEGIRTGTTVAATTARTGVQVASTAVTVASEATKTGAVVAGQAVATAATVGAQAIQAGATVAGAATSVAASATAATAQVTANAAVAASGAFASTVVIPFIGPVAAPVAAALALATVLGFGALIKSAAGGYGQVPADGTITELHKDEMVLPAWIASPLRNSIRGVGPKGGNVLSTMSSTTVSASGGNAGNDNGSFPPLHYHAAPGETPRQTAANSREMVRVMRNAWKNGEFRDMR